MPAKSNQKTKASSPKTSKLPLHKRTKENITHVHSVKQNRKSTGEKYLPLIKSTTISTNTTLKKKKPTTGKTKINLPQEEALLSLHPTDSSGNEDDTMSTNSNEGHPDIYI